MGVKFELGKELGRDFDAESLEKRFDKVFYATGAWKRPVLGFDGEEFTEFGLQFLVEVNKWMNKKKREHVVVIGGGNVWKRRLISPHLPRNRAEAGNDTPRRP